MEERTRLKGDHVHCGDDNAHGTYPSRESPFRGDTAVETARPQFLIPHGAPDRSEDAVPIPRRIPERGPKFIPSFQLEFLEGGGQYFHETS